MHLRTPQKLETGKYISLPQHEIGLVCEALYYDKWYVSKQTQDELNKIRNLCINELLINSSRWFTKQLSEAQISQRFLSVSEKWLESPTEFPTWGYDMYPYEVFNVASTPDLHKYNGREVSVRFVISYVVITPTTFHIDWIPEQIYELIEKISIDEENSKKIEELPISDKIEIVQTNENSLEVVTDFAEVTDTKIIKLNRGGNEERRKQKGNIIRSDIRELMEKLRAKQEEYDHYESYQQDDESSEYSDESESDNDTVS